MPEIEQSLTPLEISTEVRKFIQESVKKPHRTDVAEVTKGALILLRHLPGSREAVLEYICKIFFYACSRQLRNMEVHPGAPILEAPIMDTIIPDVHATLVQIVDENPEAWAPLIASWSLDLLGKLSCSFAKRGNLMNDLQISDYLRHWLMFRGARILVDLSAHCIRRLGDSAAESCMNALTESISSYTPYFDWVAAHVGSCFPSMIITRLLNWGLKDFCVTGMQKSEHNQVLNSVVGILGHLAGSHFYEIKTALLELFKWSLDENMEDDVSTRKQKIATVPFLLKLASVSQILLKVITTVVLQTLFPVRPDVIPRLAVFASDWCKYFDNQADVLIDLTVRLALACEQGASQIISILLDTCLSTSNVGYHGVNAALSVKNVCREILEMILQEIDLSMRMKGPHSTGIALLTSIKQDLSLVVPLLLDANPLRVQTAVRLLTLLGAQSPTVIISASASALRNAKTDFHLAALVRLVSENVVVFPAIKPEVENPMSGHGYLTQALEQSLRDIQYTSASKDCESRQLFRNLSTLLKWENSKKAEILASQLVSRAVTLNLEQISGLLMKTDDFELANDIAETLDLLSFSEKSSHPSSVQLTLKVTRSIIRYFFICIREEDIYRKERGVKRVMRLLSVQSCYSSSARVLALRELLSNSIFNEPSKYFGAKVNHEQKSDNLLLLSQNHKQGTSALLAQKHSSVFHAGVIGQGPRKPPPENCLDKETIALNSTLLVDAIKACCSMEDPGPYPVNLDAMTMVSLLLVELVSPDVMYNGLPWPDEEFTKVTVERDLHIRRTFRDVPLLWTLLELTARHRPALAYCSVLLRAIAATVMANWNTSDGTLLANVMALGQLLPPPLVCLRDVLPILSPNQINTVMRECIWAYMHENVPSPALFTLTEGSNIAWRDTDTSTPNIRFTETLRLLLLANIHKSGPLYATLFYNEHK
ncbi:integrator complex subunit 5 [Venturia canescens]|uniref:integrator complex subunit 5 n=1 Tax=Venturia canescens TaxID=32260 RepID=UPI001C9D326D|nr:integrator complex subunit 5 [Venturia canescens]